ncbi:uncharacterized protein SPAPADRAFT_61290 [Spathaspora passalidarum NRRL Y-27907]|uniref:Uncharacterized protein n=1 Tax=Spathaspora passalidarum (strain NRRL Y-27907 / 11-Y1) TaxID=619300 RepID=G3APN6_SPAPN|nr:uncharacterized protein SPAPADRAFT_61290 [Spathaspora passalidarum NRRL Y-27907]EGW32207.1 hypothetical protein SPAPADRAFT_61290 [Spathaspora passalidarum NRRL Y-27907]
MNSEIEQTNNSEPTSVTATTSNGVGANSATATTTTTTTTPDVDNIQVKQEQRRPKLEPSRESSMDTTPLTNQQPMHEIVGGSSVRRYLNEHLTKHLLEGLKEVSQAKPEDPLRYLGEFLINRSEELSK